MSLVAAPTAKEATGALWISAYYPGWQQHNLPPAEIDFRAVTHLVQFSVLPRSDGSLDWTKHDLDDAHIQETVRLTHAAGRKILLCVGGADSAVAFRGAMAEKTRAAFVGALVKAVKTHGYDGLDLDMEPMEARDGAAYAVFVHELRVALNAGKSGALLTAAVGDQAELFAKLQDQFDQINVMTYDLSGAWEGWVTWHNSALWNGGVKFPGSTRELPGVDLKIREWLSAGISAERLGLGLAFYGYEWAGADGPKQSIAGVKTKQISYADIMKTQFTPSRYRWDEGAAVPYLSLAKDPAKPVEGGSFITFDDERSLRLKIEYARKMKLGGAIIWELGSGWRPELPAGKRDPLLQTVRSAASVSR
ncbi:glycoside hydrolase family 18 protein [Rariglobus hedericola]